ncbi:hypothetical protein SAMN05216338_1008161 [Bradyrhizobium sp. Rc2d]|nr:hypothetical protein SAMN05216338_1008161 [Bradyrhizobium sp. Rc2d]
MAAGDRGDRRGVKRIRGAIAHDAGIGTSRRGASIHVVGGPDVTSRAGCKKRHKKPSGRKVAAFSDFGVHVVELSATTSSLRAQRSNPEMYPRKDSGLLRCARNDGGQRASLYVRHPEVPERSGGLEGRRPGCTSRPFILRGSACDAFASLAPHLRMTGYLFALNVRAFRQRCLGPRHRHGDILPLFCPTCQMDFVKSAIVRRHRQAIDSASPGYCAWVVFALFDASGLTPPLFPSIAGRRR